MTSLADNAILSGADNRPPMLDKDMYDSWKRKMKLYMLNTQNGRMILECVENGPLLWPTVKQNGVTRTKKYSKLSATEAIQADCDVKATNIILEGLPLEVYALFLNTLPPEWSKFVTDVKLVSDLHMTNVNQLHAYLGQHEYHVNEVCLMHEHTTDPLALVANHQMNKSPYQPHYSKFDTLTPELLAGPTYELMKGSYKSLVELEFFLEEVYKAMTDQLDWVNLEGASSRKYTTSITKTKAADHGHIKWIEDLVPRTIWIQEPVSYDKHALWKISYWGHKRQQFYCFAVNQDDGTLTDVRTALDDRLKGIRMKYLPQTIWRKSDKEREAAMIQAIDKKLKTRRIMRSLERIMSITKEQQQALDDALVPREQCLRIGNCNFRLSTTFKPKEPTFQVALDVLSLAHFYPAFLISASVPSIYMHEFWATGSFHNDDEDDDDQDDDNADDEDHDGQDDVNEQTESDNDGDEFVYPKLSSFDKEERHEENLDEEEEGSDQRFHTQSHLESTDDEAYNEVTQGDNVEEEKLDEEKTNKDEEVNELYNDVNINIEGKDVPVTTNDKIPLSSITTLPPPLIPLIQPVQQTSVFIPTIAPSTSIQNLLTFGSDRVIISITLAHEKQEKKVEDEELERGGRFNLRRTSVTGFPAQSIRFSNAIALDSSYLLVLITGTSQSRQHDKSESDSYYLSDLSRQFIYWTEICLQTYGSGISILLTVAFIFRQWEVPSGSGNFLTNSGNALCILFPTILP
nr:hypothetical protein [Tanacetum cinerariifolium]